MQKHGPMVQFNKITDNIYLGTNLCCTTRSHNQTLLDEGIGADIDMELENQGQVPGSDFYFRIPVKDHTAPTMVQLNVGVAVIDSLIRNHKKVYVHCKHGHGRSPTLIAAYLISQGMDYKKALETIRSKRPEIHPENSQIIALKKFEEQLQIK